MTADVGREEGDASADDAAVTDNSLGRLLTLSDGVFAIAMTLFALDLKVPSIGGSLSDGALRHALARESGTYYSFVLSFYVVASYWARHRRLMRSVKTVAPYVFGANLFLLLCVAGLPFPAALLGTHESDAITLVIYGSLNLLAVGALLLLHYLTRADHVRSGDDMSAEIHNLVATGVVFVLAIPSGYVLHGHGAYALLLLVVVRPVTSIARRLGRHKA